MPVEQRIAIIGAGLMGHGLAQVFAEAGRSVVVFDEFPEVLDSVDQRVRRNLAELGRDVEAATRITTSADLQAAVEAADFVIEACPEDLHLKRSIFVRLDNFARETAVLATNTSVIPVGEIASAVTHRARVVGTHWWNPPYLVPLVEVVQGTLTSQDTVEKTMELLRNVGKSPVHVKRDVPGFVGNRLQHALWREAFALVAEGVCDAETVDLVIKNSFGLRLAVLGPLENADLIGLDLTLAIHEHVLPYIDRTPGPSPYLRQLVADGRLGAKSGQGLYEWAPGRAEELRAAIAQHLKQAVPAIEERNEP